MSQDRFSYVIFLDGAAIAGVASGSFFAYLGYRLFIGSILFHAPPEVARLASSFVGLVLNGTVPGAAMMLLGGGIVLYSLRKAARAERQPDES